MTVVVWDGESMAADKQSENNGLPSLCTKIFRIPDGRVVGFTGALDAGLLLTEWVTQGERETDWPGCQKDNDIWTRVIVASKDGCYFYEKVPKRMMVQNDYQAWGSGRDVAIGALAMGATAKEAVEVTNKHHIYCGLGVDVLKL